VAFVHPNSTAEVTHPDHAHLRGVVVGIEQHSQTLRFVVEFGTAAAAAGMTSPSSSSASTASAPAAATASSSRRRELWSGRKVRPYLIPI